LKPIVQVANINIPKIISKQWDIDIDIFKNGDIGRLFEYNLPWLNTLIKLTTLEQLKASIDSMPDSLKEQLQKLIDIVQDVKYDNITISPLYYNGMKYYDDVYYKVIQNNHTIAKGGGYKSNGIKSLGFAIYTDQLLKIKER
jgi:histidyl-tRNA synthetase